MKKIQKKPTSVRLDDDLISWLEDQSTSQSDAINEALRLVSQVDWEAIKELSKKHLVFPSLLVDAAVLYFSKLDLPEQKDKLIDYLEIMRQQALKREKMEEKES